MTHETTDLRPTTASLVESGEGDGLYEVYRRLVSVHHALSTHALPDPELRRHATVRIEEALRFIEGRPEFRAASEAAEPARRARIAERRAKATPRP